MAYPYRWESGAENAAEGALAKLKEIVLTQIGADNTAAIIAEPLQGEGGFIVPAPGFLKGVQDFCREHGILVQSWSPIGGITSYRGSEGQETTTFDDPTIAQIAQAHQATPAQVMLRWQLQRGRQVIPKSVNPERIRENLDVFGFELSDDELGRLDALNTGVRGGPEPHQVTLEDFGKEIPEA